MGTVSVIGEVTSVSQTTDGYRVSVDVREDSSDEYFTNVTVHGYGPAGRHACSKPTPKIGGGDNATINLECDRFPQVIFFVSDQLGQEHPEAGISVYHVVLGYAGFENGSHRWKTVGRVEETGNPPNGDPDERGTLFDEVRCLQRWNEANVSVYPTADWTDEPPKYPRVEDRYDIAVQNMSGATETSQEPMADVGAFRSAEGGTSDAPPVVRRAIAAERDRYGGRVIRSNESEFFAVVEWAEGEEYTDWRSLPSEGPHVRQRDFRYEDCERGSGTYTGSFVRDYRYVTTVDGERVGLVVSYSRTWHTANGSVSNAPPSDFFRVSDRVPSLYRQATNATG